MNTKMKEHGRVKRLNKVQPCLREAAAGTLTWYGTIAPLMEKAAYSIVSNLFKLVKE